MPSYMKELQLTLLARKHGGRLVHYYDQGQDPRIKKDELTDGGWCYAMAACWLANDDSSAFWKWMMTTKAEMTLRTRMARQAIIKAQLRGSRGSDKNSKFRWTDEYKSKVGFDTSLVAAAEKDNRHLLKNMLTGSGIRVVQEEFIYGDEASGYWRLAYKLNTPKRPMFGVGLFYKSGGAHQVAARLVDTDLRYMDPNHGEYTIPKDKLSDFFFDLEFDYGLPSLSSFEVAYCA